ncbi:hypothetical protein [Sulfobacillus thermosulfidooxidans]|uniref:hypothetical protein n=1 Tax=Sulfobacillus thermosulfidooxidans TaxID=28034 RepID=UPI0006B50D60|nr:hypothetical protein [Sulfobacillus thermosulfidooxidans]
MKIGPQGILWTGVLTPTTEGLDVVVPVSLSLLGAGDSEVRAFLQQHGFPGKSWQVVWSLSSADDPGDGASGQDKLKGGETDDAGQ